jgi:putative endonuclease
VTATVKPGRDAEDAAVAYLQSHGLRCLARNYQCRFGEIDLIMREGDVVVFVEVRARRSAAYGGAAASIGAAKREKLIAAARWFLAGRTSVPACRFDAVLIEGEPARVQWLRGAFEA